MRSTRGYVLLTILLISALTPALAGVPPAKAQIQYVSVSRGVINLGMTTAITATAPSAGDYTLVVVLPDKTQVSLPFTFSGSGENQTAVFGNTTLGFKTAVTQVGTYNVFLEQAGTSVSSTAFYATNKLNVAIDFVNGGLCNYIAGAPRGTKIFPRFYITYASNGAPLNKSSNVVVSFTLPDNTAVLAAYHRPTTEAPVPYGFYIGKFQPSWNFTAVGPWSLTAHISDGLGNNATYVYSGPPFELTPTQLDASVLLIDNSTSQTVGGLYTGQIVDVSANFTYPTNPEPVPGFVGPLDVNVHGGSVSAAIGWGFYNSTTGSFGGTKNPGGLITSTTLSYSGHNGTWTGKLEVSTLPSIPAKATYEVVVTASDKASPANAGMALVDVPLAASAPSTTTTTTQASSSAEALSPTVALLTAVGTLIVGLVVGVIVRRTA